jgi:hypothetical protein
MTGLIESVRELKTPCHWGSEPKMMQIKFGELPKSGTGGTPSQRKYQESYFLHQNVRSVVFEGQQGVDCLQKNQVVVRRVV